MHILQMQKKSEKEKSSIDLRSKIMHKKNSIIPAHRYMKRVFSVKQGGKRQRLENILSFSNKCLKMAIHCLGKFQLCC